MKFILITFIVLFQTILSYGADVQNSQKWNNILYIFDASGTMFGKLDVNTKIDVAKRVLTNLVSELPDTVNVGLMYFGNKVKGRDCLRFPVKIANGTKNEIIDQINKLDAGGLTPLAGSLEAAGNFLAEKKIGATIILITDGKEECGGNPLEAVKNLHKKGIDVELHIVGLGVSEDEKKQLEEMAALGGGTFYLANTSEEVKNAIRNATPGAPPATTASNAMKLTANANAMSYSKKLHSLLPEETLKIKFKPVKPVTDKNASKNSILFSFDTWALNLDDQMAKWKLIVIVGDTRHELAWPEGLTLKRNEWNEISFTKSGGKAYLVINDKPVLLTGIPNNFSDLKVGVTGYEAEFKDLSVQIPMY